MNYILAISLLIISYLLGSIPSALIIGKTFKNVDVREHGSKNLGATNTFRVLGLKMGLAVFVMDAVKAAIVVGLVQFNAFGIKDQVFHCLIYGVIAIIGHLFPIFADFRGGKGVSCTVGVMFTFNPLCAFIAFIAWAITMKISKIVSLSALVSSIVLFITSIVQIIILGPNLDTTTFVIITFLVVIMLFDRHKANIKRLANHTESKISDFNKK